LVAAEGKAGMKKCGGKNPITALDGALSRAYFDTEIDRRRGAGLAPARPSS
jgi:hypothetical protein